MASQSNNSEKKEDSVASLTFEAISVVLDLHRKVLAAEFKTSFGALETKFDQVLLVVQDHG